MPAFGAFTRLRARATFLGERRAVKTRKRPALCGYGQFSTFLRRNPGKREKPGNRRRKVILDRFYMVTAGRKQLFRAFPRFPWFSRISGKARKVLVRLHVRCAFSRFSWIFRNPGNSRCLDDFHRFSAQNALLTRARQKCLYDGGPNGGFLRNHRFPWFLGAENAEIKRCRAINWLSEKSLFRDFHPNPTCCVGRISDPENSDSYKSLGQFRRFPGFPPFSNLDQPCLQEFRKSQKTHESGLIVSGFYRRPCTAW